MVNQTCDEACLSRASGSEGSLFASDEDACPEEHRDEGPLLNPTKNVCPERPSGARDLSSHPLTMRLLSERSESKDLSRTLALLHSYTPSTLQRFAKGLLRLVVLVAVSFVKLVRALANHVRSHGHALAG